MIHTPSVFEQVLRAEEIWVPTQDQKLGTAWRPVFVNSKWRKS